MKIHYINSFNNFYCFLGRCCINFRVYIASNAKRQNDFNKWVQIYRKELRKITKYYISITCPQTDIRTEDPQNEKEEYYSEANYVHHKNIVMIKTFH